MVSNDDQIIVNEINTRVRFYQNQIENFSYPYIAMINFLEDGKHLLESQHIIPPWIEKNGRFITVNSNLLSTFEEHYGLKTNFNTPNQMSKYATFSKLGEKKEGGNVPPCMEIQDLAHKKKLLKDNNVVCVDLWGEWCGPCKAIAPKFAQLAQKYNSSGRCLLVKENVDLQLPREQEVEGIPTFLFYKGGHPIRLPDGTFLKVVGGNLHGPQGVEEVLQKLLKA